MRPVRSSRHYVGMIAPLRAARRSCFVPILLSGLRQMGWSGLFLILAAIVAILVRGDPIGATGSTKPLAELRTTLAQRPLGS
jgi:hypothetical protein